MGFSFSLHLSKFLHDEDSYCVICYIGIYKRDVFIMNCYFKHCKCHFFSILMFFCVCVCLNLTLTVHIPAFLLVACSGNC